MELTRPEFSAAAVLDPSSISGLTLWLEADYLALSNGAAISPWTDLSSNAFQLTQADNSRRPTFRTNRVNGRSAADFDGTDVLSRASTQLSSTGVYHLFAIIKMDAFASLQIPANCDTDQLIRVETDGIVRPLPQNNGTIESLTQMVAGTYHLVETRAASSSDGAAYIDGLTAASKGSPGVTLNSMNGTLTVGAFSTGPGFPMDGDIAALLVWNRSLTSDEQHSIRDWIMQRYLNRAAPVLTDLGSAEVGVQGDWVGVYGADGYYLFNPVFDGMTPTVTTSDLSTWNFGTTTAARGLENPSQDAIRNKSGLFTATTGLVRIGPISGGYDGSLHIHTTVDDNSVDRRGRYTVFTQEQQFVDVDFAHTNGAWSHFPSISVASGGYITIKVERTGGANFFISGVWLGES